MTTSSRAGWVRLLPLVGLIVLLLRWAYAPPAAPEDERLRAQAAGAGFGHERTTLRMWHRLANLEPAVWADGFSLRTYAGDDGPAVKALLDRAYRGWDDTYVARPLDDWAAFMTGHDEFDPELWFLFERDGALVACALHWREHQGRGWLKDLVVDERERGRGLGSALVRHGLRVYADRGAARVGLKVDDAKPTGASSPRWNTRRRRSRSCSSSRGASNGSTFTGSRPSRHRKYQASS